MSPDLLPDDPGLVQIMIILAIFHWAPSAHRLSLTLRVSFLPSNPRRVWNTLLSHRLEILWAVLLTGSNTMASFAAVSGVMAVVQPRTPTVRSTSRVSPNATLPTQLYPSSTLLASNACASNLPIHLHETPGTYVRVRYQ